MKCLDEAEGHEQSYEETKNQLIEKFNQEIPEAMKAMSEAFVVHLERTMMTKK